MRLELIFTDKAPLIDFFITSFQKSLIEIFVPLPTLNGNPTLRAQISRLQQTDLDIGMLPPNLDIKHCAVLSFELFDTRGNKVDIRGTSDDTFRAYHCSFADGTYQMLFDDLPSFDGTSSKVEQYTQSATRFILAQLVH